MTNDLALQHMTIDGCEIAIRQRLGTKNPGLMWLSGYRSDMLGGKAETVDAYARENNLSCLRFDYSGHGESKGDFFKGNISTWLKQSLCVFEKFAQGPQILIGSSMGGWLALLLARELKKRNITLAGMILLAPAADFTHDLIEPELDPIKRQALKEQGYFEVANDYGPEPTPFTQNLLDDGRKNLVLKGLIDIGCPIHILQGMQDEAVPYQHSLKLMQHLPLENAILTFIHDGDHRLSRESDLQLLRKTISAMIELKDELQK